MTYYSSKELIEILSNSSLSEAKGELSPKWEDGAGQDVLYATVARIKSLEEHNLLQRERIILAEKVIGEFTLMLKEENML